MWRTHALQWMRHITMDALHRSKPELWTHVSYPHSIGDATNQKVVGMLWSGMRLELGVESDTRVGVVQ